MDAFRININNLHIAFLTKDDPTVASFEKPELLAGTMQIQFTPRVATAPLYGDGHMRHQEILTDGYGITLDHNKIPPKILARMRGQEYEGGVRRSNKADTAVYFALGYNVDLTGGHKELTWLPKCVAAPSNKNVQQRTENINYSTDSLTVTSMALEYNGDYEYAVDTSDTESGFTPEQVDNWFEEVPVLPPKGAETTPKTK